MSDLDPIVGNWYKDLESEADFEVVAVDEAAQTVAIQYFEGEVEELDLDAWNAMVLEPIEPPEDWSGPFDDLEPDDLDDGANPGPNPAWDDPLKN
nr:hypothetical protein [Pseudomonadota bacterium]